MDDLSYFEQESVAHAPIDNSFISIVELLQWDELSQDQIDNRQTTFKPAYTRIKFSVCVLTAFAWLSFCTYLSIPWIYDLAYYLTLIPAVIIVASIALIPGFMYIFLILSYTVDRRKVGERKKTYPFVSILIAAYNEESCIARTLEGIKNQEYPAGFEVILIDDGSGDNTVQIAEASNLENLIILRANHGGKANALNFGLEQAKARYIITLDADTLLLKNAVQELMDKLLSAQYGTVACAGSIYVSNVQHNLMTKIQTWDYFLAIAMIKRSQSFLQGTLVAQGAFSVYEKKVLKEVGGWPNMVGEDIVLTWALLNKGYYIDFAEKAMAFTSVPTTYRQFFFQRSRWARGLIEAFRRYPALLLRRRLSTFYIYWNLGFILFDSIFFFIFMPGMVAALFGKYYIAGPMTLLVLPLGFLSNYIFSSGQKRLFVSQGIPVQKNALGFFLYTLCYQYMMNPAVIHGYVSEFLSWKKSWGTK
ncbi:MAG: glycosyltransferase [Legionellaceae bacterium]|nr:glycosyltransferase [Legionellaceae bacterium]